MLAVIGIVLLVVGLSLIMNKIEENKDADKALNIIGTICCGIASLLVLFSIVRVVPAGHVGVIDLFGKVKDRILQPGINFVNPFSKVVKMNVKTQEIKKIMTVPSKEGLAIDLDVSVLYRLQPEKTNEIYKTVGYYYQDVILVPPFRSVARGVTVSHEAKALYTSGREEIADKLHSDLQTIVKPRGIVIESVLLRKIQLPATVGNAIEQKLKAEQEAEQMKFVLDKEKKEAERRIIEAGGIAKAQEIINKTLTPNYLQHEAIQAQQKMANSPNHSTVYIPVGTNGIPLVYTPK
jgi:regulator of protease activity HflC (stomatin/prohibitin superfamily)